jgi:glyoxylase-like metal-dependent hydrolase (beta-lactamase superfamily II)
MTGRDAAGPGAGRTVLEVTPAELARTLEGGAPVQLLDVRAPERVERGVVGPVPDERFFNVRGSELFARDDPEAHGLDPAHEVAVVCGHGNDSLRVAAWLVSKGYDAHSLSGGVTAWMRLSVPRPLAPPEGFDRLVQLDRVGKGALGYLLVSGDEAAAIDVSRWTDAWERAAEEAGARITAVFDTHVHADYISGGPALAERLAAPWYLHPADMVWPYDGTPGRLGHEPLAEGTDVPIGRGTVRTLHTPGHTEGSVSLVAGDGAVFTGDFLFVDSLGRPDLAGRTEAWSEDLWRSAERARTDWDPAWVVRPAHCTDSERNRDRSIGRPLARLREENEALRRAAERDAFLAWVRESERPAPDAYRLMKAINVGLVEAGPDESDALEAGRHECALG